MKRKRHPIMESEVVGAVSNSFREVIAEAINTIPDGVQKHLHESGFKFRLARHLVESDPETAAIPARGHEGGRTFRYLFGFADLTNKKVVVSEWADTEPQYMPPHPPERTNPFPAQLLRHELAHCVDFTLGGYTSTDEFIDVCQKECGAVPAEHHQALAYYLQMDETGLSDAGREEIFAEIFATLCGGGCDFGEIAELLCQNFSKTRTLIEKQLKQLKRKPRQKNSGEH